MSDFDNRSRVDKFEKRRKNTKLLSIMLVVGSIFIIVLIGMFIFGGGDDETAEPPNNITIDEGSNDNTEEEQSDNSTSTDDENASDESVDADNESENNTNVETNPVESNDENVSEAYTGNWEPIGTEQQGEHTTNYDEGSQDRLEMEKAISLATGLQQDDMIVWWLERGGDQEVISTVSNGAETENYRVYLNWVENQGWQPTKVEILKENDQKWRFE